VSAAHMVADEVNTFLLKHRKDLFAPRIQCNDGFSMSVQGSHFHYCSPREDNGFPYRSVEIGFPSGRLPEAHEYAEDKKRHTKTVFGYVPVRIVNEIIRKHGGIKWPESEAA
jgi:hypothetical protein